MKVRGERLKALRRKRRGDVALEDRSLASSTRVRYFIAVSKILPRLEATSEDFDLVLASYIEELYHTGEGITTASDTLCGLHHYMPSLRGQLRQSWRLYRIWRKVEKPQQAPPFPILVFLGLLGRCLEMDHLRFAALLCLGFWGMLRTGEILNLQRRHLLFSDENLVIQLGLTKTGLRRAIDENVVIYEEVPRLIIAAFLDIAKLGPMDYLWSKTPQQFRASFRWLLSFFKIQHLFRPYSLRRGGATEDFRQHGLMERTLLRGRWGTSTAARHYVQEGLTVLTALQIPQKFYIVLLSYAKSYFGDLPVVRSAPGYVDSAAGGSLRKGNSKRKKPDG